MKATALLLTLSLFLLSCGKEPQSEYYYDDPHADYLSAKAWNSQSLPITIKVPASLQEYEAHILNAGEQWNTALGQPVFLFEFDAVEDNQYATSSSSLADEVFGLFRQRIWNFSTIGSTVLAYTSSLSQGNNIVHADIIFNFDTYLFADHDYPPVGVGENYVDFESVLIHELGHFLGLGHTSINEDLDSVMLPTLKKGAARRELSYGDIEKIRSLYLRL